MVETIFKTTIDDDGHLLILNEYTGRTSISDTLQVNCIVQHLFSARCYSLVVLQCNTLVVIWFVKSPAAVNTVARSRTKSISVRHDNIGYSGSIPEIDINLSLNTHIDFYACYSRTNVHATIVDYVYSSASVPVLTINGSIAVHDYKLRFCKDLRTCHGSLEYVFYETGSDPFDLSNKPK
ncbi:unnamed protein product [Adineta ricciae]|uniref:Uncharacterized protein n=1 Tax=Adineta ricciae TaxID=249248 RepID=A0A813NIA1_ADIRI|nr:unnamed protein product [Adineta ricciae]CAF1658788.1 unnamed protein product [Adineta ricciae]